MVSFDEGSASKVDDVTALPSRYKMADMCYYGNVMTTTRWWLCGTILHLQQYSHRLNFFAFFFPKSNDDRHFPEELCSQEMSNGISMFHRAFFNSIIDKHQPINSTFNSILV